MTENRLNIVSLKTDISPGVVDGLRILADMIERGEIDAPNITCATGNLVFHYGDINDSVAAVNGVWNLTYALHFLMAAARGAND